MAERVAVWRGHDDEGHEVTGEAIAHVAPVTTSPRPVLVDLGEPGRDEDMTATMLGQLVDGAHHDLPKGPYRIDSVVAGSKGPTFMSINKKDATIEGGGRWIKTLVTPEYPDGWRYEPGFIGWTDRWGYDLGCVNQNGDSTRRHWTAGAAARKLTFRGVDILGPNSLRDADPRRAKHALFREKACFEHAMQVNGGAEDVTWEHMRYTNVGGDGKYIGGTDKPALRTRFDRASGMYAGRQLWGFAWADGITAIDCVDRYGARSGWDVEPYVRDEQYVANTLALRCVFSCLFNPVALGGDVDEIGLIDYPNRRVNFSFIDCLARDALSSRQTILAPRGGIGLTVINFKDTRNRATSGIALSGWHNSFIDQTEITTGFTSKDPTRGVIYAGCSGRHELYNSKFNEPMPVLRADGTYGPNSKGALELATIVRPEADFELIQGGNEWGQGRFHDGPDPRLAA